jgi:hypothetical protein
MIPVEPAGDNEEKYDSCAWINFGEEACEILPIRIQFIISQMKLLLNLGRLMDAHVVRKP